ncbi:mitochondrial thiamine pyrophosphate carrier 1 [Trichodelitschia bisporula]|uniref:Mitochondrial thiamine pyrophosphate carrier 1 n=1 Tax=Trichodelitschia bisporula TaxID=703511 RepID=A0A6G1HX60_9PEZI|nr:mitochondrial thiamine pyrophosphate carrier 1 [Trichodelitschia bisporula]
MSKDVKALKHEGSSLQSAIAGATAGLVSRFCIAPLDVLKIRLQLQIHSLADPLKHQGRIRPSYKGTVGTLKQILREEGVRALWKGNVPAEGLYLSYSSIQFLSYKTLSDFIKPENLPFPCPESGTTFMTGATAGVIATTSTYPLDLLRTRFAAQGQERVYSGLMAGIRQIHQSEGPKGFFRGLTAANVQIVPYMGLFFMLYETFKPLLNSIWLPLDWAGSADGTAGTLATVIGKTVVYPLDTVRKRLQVQGPNRSRFSHKNIPEYTGILETIKTILRREGFRGMYRGLPVALLKAAPASAATIWTYERTMSLLLKVEKSGDHEV